MSNPTVYTLMTNALVRRGDLDPEEVPDFNAWMEDQRAQGILCTYAPDARFRLTEAGAAHVDADPNPIVFYTNNFFVPYPPPWGRALAELEALDA